MKSILGGFLGGLCAVALLGAAWTAGYEGTPPGTALASDLDTYIQGFKTEVRQRLEVEHRFGQNTDDNGLHSLGSARCFQQNAAPTDIDGGTAARGQYNSAAGTDAGTDLTTEEVGVSTDDIGKGRCWIDVDGPDNTAGNDDDYSLYFWDETANAWVATGIQTTGLSTLFGPGKSNLLYNGQFEATDGTGRLASTSVPLGWTLVNTPTIGYTDLTATPQQGEGISLKITAAGGADEGITQTLKGLKASTSYYAVARAMPGVALDSCTLRTTGGSTNVTSTIAAGTSWTTLNGFFTTDATPTDVVLRLESDVDGDVCHFDYVAVYETSTDRKSIPDPKIEVSTAAANATTTTVTDADPIIQDSGGDWQRNITVPRPGYSILVLADVAIGHVNGTCHSPILSLKEEVNGGGFAVVRTTVAAVGQGTNDAGSTMLHFIRSNPTPGSIYSYLITADCNAGQTATINEAQTGHNLDSLFSVLLIPTG